MQATSWRSTRRKTASSRCGGWPCSKLMYAAPLHPFAIRMRAVLPVCKALWCMLKDLGLHCVTRGRSHSPHDCTSCCSNARNGFVCALLRRIAAAARTAPARRLARLVTRPKGRRSTSLQVPCNIMEPSRWLLDDLWRIRVCRVRKAVHAPLLLLPRVHVHDLHRCARH